MGLLIKGKWHDQWYDTDSNDGEFVRQRSRFEGRITADGSSGFVAEMGRYHLYVSMACPWAHRTLIMRRLKGLAPLIPVSVVDPRMGDEGWVFSEARGDFPDRVHGAQRLHQLYSLADPGYSGRVTVPVLWDLQRQTIVSNESALIIRCFNSAFDELTGNRQDYYPVALRPQIDEVNELVYEGVNNGVYSAGFATTQAAHERAVVRLFAVLDGLEARLSRQRYLVGDRITEADWRLFTTLIRFDSVYHGHFKCNLRRLVDYPNLWKYTRELYQWPGVSGTVDLEQIKTHYYWSHTTINPHRVVPRGPALHLDEAHDRERLPASDSSGQSSEAPERQGLRC